jgi:hypothetical protein
MATWIQSLLARPQIGDPQQSNSTEPQHVAAIHRDWVLALTALVLGQSDRREVRHG